MPGGKPLVKPFDPPLLVEEPPHLHPPTGLIPVHTMVGPEPNISLVNYHSNQSLTLRDIIIFLLVMEPC